MADKYSLDPSPNQVGATGQSQMSMNDGPYNAAGQTAYDIGTGFWLGVVSGIAKFSIGNSAGNKMTWDGTTLSITGSLSATTGTIGGFDIGTDYIRDVANSMGLSSTVTGGDDVRFWAGDTFANRASAPFRVTEAGVVTATNITITGGSVATSTLSGIINLSNLNVSAQGWTHTNVFSVLDADTVQWGAGTFTTAAGVNYSIGAGNTGNMAAQTYIYLDINVSTTAYQVTTTASTAVGSGKVLIGTAINGSVEPTYQIFGGIGGTQISGGSIVPASITGGEIAALTITASNIAASTITSNEIAANTITAGDIAAATITTTEIAANTILAGNLAAGSVTTEKLTVGSVADSIIVNGGFEEASTASPTIPALWTSSVIGGDGVAALTTVAGEVHSGTQAIKLTTSAGVGNYIAIRQTAIANIAVNEGELWYGAVWAKQSVATSGFYFRIWWGSTQGGSELSLTDLFADQTLTTSYAKYEAQATVPAGAKWASIEFYNYQPASSTIVYLDDVTFRQAVTGVTIVNGTITAGKLSVSQLSAITADLGAITAGTVTLNTAGGHIKSGQTAYDTGTGFWLGNDGGTSKFSIGNSAGNKLTWDGTTLSITGSLTATTGTIGGFSIGADYIRDAADSFGMASTVSGGDDVRFWAGDTFANRATAPFRVTESGDVTASDIHITGGEVATSTLLGLVGLANTNLAAQGWTQTSGFSVLDADTVQWGAGTFTNAAGTSYSINAGNTGNMAARTYIYLDIGVSTTDYQVTTTATTAVGTGKVLIATALNGSIEPTFEVFSGIGGSNINGSSIVAASITGSEVAANTITAGNLSVSQLSAIAADMGSLTAGTITLDGATGNIKSGQTDYNTGTGFFLGRSGGNVRFSIGNSSGSALTWDGATLSLSGAPTVKEIISASTLIAVDYQMVLIDTLTIESDVTLNGTLAII